MLGRESSLSPVIQRRSATPRKLLRHILMMNKLQREGFVKRMDPRPLAEAPASTAHAQRWTAPLQQPRWQCCCSSVSAQPLRPADSRVRTETARIHTDESHQYHYVKTSHRTVDNDLRWSGGCCRGKAVTRTCSRRRRSSFSSNSLNACQSFTIGWAGEPSSLSARVIHSEHGMAPQLCSWIWAADSGGLPIVKPSARDSPSI
jgi:hypothetical protein